MQVPAVNTYLPGGITTAWQKVSIPLSVFTGIDMTKVNEITFYISGLNDVTQDIYIDDVQFIRHCATATPSVSSTASRVPSVTATPSITATRTTLPATPTSTLTPTPTQTWTGTPPTSTDTATFTPTQPSTLTPQPSFSSTPTPQPNSPTPTATPTVTPIATTDDGTVLTYPNPYNPDLGDLYVLAGVAQNAKSAAISIYTDAFRLIREVPVSGPVLGVMVLDKKYFSGMSKGIYYFVVSAKTPDDKIRKSGIQNLIILK
jgi:hypothetical protein